MELGETVRGLRIKHVGRARRRAALRLAHAADMLRMQLMRERRYTSKKVRAADACKRQLDTVVE